MASVFVPELCYIFDGLRDTRLHTVWIFQTGDGGGGRAKDNPVAAQRMDVEEGRDKGVALHEEEGKWEGAEIYRNWGGSGGK